MQSLGDPAASAGLEGEGVLRVAGAAQRSFRAPAVDPAEGSADVAELADCAAGVADGLAVGCPRPDREGLAAAMTGMRVHVPGAAEAAWLAGSCEVAGLVLAADRAGGGWCPETADAKRPPLTAEHDG